MGVMSVALAWANARVRGRIVPAPSLRNARVVLRRDEVRRRLDAGGIPGMQSGSGVHMLSDKNWLVGGSRSDYRHCCAEMTDRGCLITPTCLERYLLQSRDQGTFVLLSRLSW